MDTVIHEVVQIVGPQGIHDESVSNVIERCYLSWSSVYNKYQRDMAHINSDLAPDLKAIMMSQNFMVTVAKALLLPPYNSSGLLTSIKCLAKQSRETSCRINDLINTVSEWGSVPRAVHAGLSVWGAMLERQTIDLALIYFVLQEAQRERM
jgi:hypothetical protein